MAAADNQSRDVDTQSTDLCAYDAIASDKQTRAFVLTGMGDHFCSGAKRELFSTCLWP